MTTNGIRIPVAKWLPTPLLSDGFGSAFGTSDGLGHAEGVAGGIGAGGGGVTLSNAGGTWSVSGGKAVNTPSVGAEVLTNGDFSSWTGDNPDGWTLSAAEDAGQYVTEVSGAFRFFNDTAKSLVVYQAALTVGTWYRMTVDAVAVATGSAHLRDATNGLTLPVSTTGAKLATGRAASAIVWIYRLSGPADFTIDNFSIKAFTLSELLTLSNLSCADVYAGVAITKSNIYVQAGLALNWDSDSSPANGLIVYLSGGNIVVDKCVAGTWTNVSTTAYTYSAGARLVCTMNAGALWVYYNDALITTATIVDAGILTGTYHGLFSTDASNTLDDLTIYATGTGGEHSQLDSHSGALNYGNVH